ncbi:MAG: glycolate oxidase subunit GlcE [Geothrix sp.]|nr:glycolate oxidase subunit GlcE [Geothrix sp.]
MSVEAFRERILQRKPLCIRSGGSKDFYGGPPAGEPLDVSGHRGIVSYEPSELVVTARAGTPLAELGAALAERGQWLAFEPPGFQGGATLGGALAAGLSGPGRASQGALRDFVLGVQVMDGEGRVLTFGGQVMKNVAGFDVSRLMAGSLGTLGLILEASIKVLPRPVAQATLRFQLPQDRALEAMNRWAGRPLPVMSTAWEDQALTVRLAGAEAAVREACATLGGERVPEGEAADHWAALRDQRLPFFSGSAPLWRLSLPPTTPPLDLPGDSLIEWGGAQRWLRGELDATALRDRARRAGGHATLFRGGDRTSGVFTPLPEPLAAIHRRLKAVFDPHGVFNRGRLFPDL